MTQHTQHDEHVCEFRPLKQHDDHMEAYRIYMRGMWGNQNSHVHAYYADLVDNGPAERDMAAFMEQMRPKRTSEEQAAVDAATEAELLAFERELYGPFYYVERNSDPSKPTVGSEWLSATAKAEARKGRKVGPTTSGTGKPHKPRKSRGKPVFWSPKKD
jgi:hypothetical protein